MTEYTRGYEQPGIPPAGEDSKNMAYLPLLAILAFGVFALLIGFLSKMG